MSRIFEARVTAQIRAAGMRGVEAAARDILAKADRLVPRDTGKLQRSGFVERQDTRVAVGYNDSKATAAHENTRTHHTNGRQAKFLEQPLTANASTVADSIAREIRVETR